MVLRLLHFISSVSPSIFPRRAALIGVISRSHYFLELRKSSQSVDPGVESK